MKNKGTEKFRCFLTSGIICFVIFFAVPVYAMMHQLSQFQTSIFHIAPDHSAITSERFKNDQYIDSEQADEFIKASEVEVYLPLDHYYPFSLIDYYTADTDLVVSYAGYHPSILCAYPPAMFLSRDYIFRSEYAYDKIPPEIYITKVTAPEPFQNQRVTAMSMSLHNFHLYSNEYIHYWAPPLKGHLIGGYMHYTNTPADEHLVKGYLFGGNVYSSGCLSVWISRDEPPPKNIETEKMIKITCPSCQ